MFEGTSGYNHLGDIAIDDITIATTSVPCAVLPGDAIPFGCNFEYNTCGWRLGFSPGSYKWKRQSGTQATQSRVGTRIDHTIGKGNQSLLEVIELSG